MEIRLWKLIFDCGKKHISSCFASGRTGTASLTAESECDKNHGKRRWQREKRNGRKFRFQLSSTESCLDSKQPKKPQSEILQDKVVCKLCTLQLAYHSTTSNIRAHLENVLPNEHAKMSGTPTKQPCLDSYFSTPATSSLSAARQEVCKKASEREVYGLKSFTV